MFARLRRKVSLSSAMSFTCSPRAMSMRTKLDPMKTGRSCDEYRSHGKYRITTEARRHGGASAVFMLS